MSLADGSVNCLRRYFAEYQTRSDDGERMPWPVSETRGKIAK